MQNRLKLPLAIGPTQTSPPLLTDPNPLQMASNLFTESGTDLHLSHPVHAGAVHGGRVQHVPDISQDRLRISQHL